MVKSLHPALTLLLLLVLLINGCANRYVIRLSNGNEITTRNKPRLDEKTNAIRYKNADGENASVPALKVTAIEAL